MENLKNVYDAEGVTNTNFRLKNEIMKLLKAKQENAFQSGLDSSTQ